MDVLCHGVANKSIVNGYLNDKQKKIHKKINDYRFRVNRKIAIVGLAVARECVWISMMVQGL